MQTTTIIVRRTDASLTDERAILGYVLDLVDADERVAARRIAIELALATKDYAALERELTAALNGERPWEITITTETS